MSNDADQLATDVRAVMEQVFGCPFETRGSVTRDDVPEWDSLMHIELILALEDHFDVRFLPDELGDIRSLDDIVAAVARARASS